MLLLFDTAAGFALFKVLDEKKLEDAQVRGASQPPQPMRGVLPHASAVCSTHPPHARSQDLWEDFETIDKAQKVRGGAERTGHALNERSYVGV